MKLAPVTKVHLSLCFGLFLTLAMLNKLRCPTHFRFSANQMAWSRFLIQIHVFITLNSVDPDLLASSEPTDLNLPFANAGHIWVQLDQCWVCRKIIFVILHVGSFMVLSYFLNHSSSQCTQMSWPFISCTQMHPIMGQSTLTPNSTLQTSNEWFS